MQAAFDPNKNARNIAERGLSFERAADFDFETALVGSDDRSDYGETRYVALGYLDGRLHVLYFTETDYGIRVISFRKANSREVNAMSARKPLIDEHGEVRELTAADLKGFKPGGEALPPSLRTKVGVRGRQKAPTKIPLSLRLSPQVVEAFRASGDGWQTRIDVVLAEWLKTHSPDELAV
jgi:uncharacterized DUF497 family protein